MNDTFFYRAHFKLTVTLVELRGPPKHGVGRSMPYTLNLINNCIAQRLRPIPMHI